MASNNDLKSLTECSVCYSQLLEPKILPCGHCFCLDCIKRLYQSGASHVFECPECRSIHQIPHTMLPTDFKLKQVVEMMHRMLKDQGPGGEWRKKICSQCSDFGDIKNYFICETCSDGDPDLMQVYCSLCILKKHKSHEIKEALDEMKVELNSALDNNVNIIEQIKHDTEFFRSRFEVQNNQIAFFFHMILDLCEKTKASVVNNEFSFKHAQMSDELGRFLEKTREDINRVFNESDNCIYQLCMNIMTSFEEAFGIQQSAMGYLKSKITKNEPIDLSSILLDLPKNEPPKDELPNFEAAGPSSFIPVTVTNANNLPAAFNDVLQSPNLDVVPNFLAANDLQQSSRNQTSMGFGRRKLLKKRR